MLFRSYITGVYLFNLPIEEVLFFIAIPYACVFTLHCFGLILENKTYDKVSYVISSLLIFSLGILGIVFIHKLYTAITFLSLAVVIFFLHFILKARWLGRFYMVYPVLLIPFFIVNGILTGSGLKEPIVSYNNNENLAIRIFTIPVEDIFFGILLVITNLGVYDFIKHSMQNSKSAIPAS